jgi:hypothetical protein
VFTFAAGLWLASTPVAAEPAEAAPLRAGLEIDASELGSTGTLLEERIADHVEAALRAEEVLSRRSRDDGTISIKLRDRATSGGFAFDVHAELAGEAVPEASRTEICERCDEGELVTAISESVVGTLPALRERQPRSTLEPGAQPPPPELTGPGSDPGRAGAAIDDRARRLGPLGKAGIGILVGGIAGTVVGAVFVARGEQVSSAPGEVTTRGRDFDVPGVVLLATGGAATAAGVIMLVADRARSRRRTMSMVPLVSPRAAGIMLTSRF